MLAWVIFVLILIIVGTIGLVQHRWVFSSLVLGTGFTTFALLNIVSVINFLMNYWLLIFCIVIVSLVFGRIFALNKYKNALKTTNKFIEDKNLNLSESTEDREELVNFLSDTYGIRYNMRNVKDFETAIDLNPKNEEVKNVILIWVFLWLPILIGDVISFIINDFGQLVDKWIWKKIINRFLDAFSGN